MKGWIVLDIDGTITLDKYSVPKEVIAYLRSESLAGWQIALATGRAFTFASFALSEFDFPYVFLVQNGSAVFEMPDKKLLFKKYLSARAIPAIEKASADFVVYAGYEKGDFCYWRPDQLSKEGLEYLEEVQKREKGQWKAVKQFEVDSFPLIKCFATAEQSPQIVKRLQATGLFQITEIRDPFVGNISVLLVTEKDTSKGLSLKEVFRLKGRGERVIAAGDDVNDESLFEVADFKIAMPHAPEKLRKMADLIAPPTSENGIISALKKATS